VSTGNTTDPGKDVGLGTVVAVAVAVGSSVFVGGIGVGEGAIAGGTDVEATPQPDAVISSASTSKTNPMDFFTI